MDALKFRLQVYSAAFLSIMILGTLGFAHIEGLSLADAFYFTLVTVTTVGYGDIHPGTATGKVLAVILIVGGVGTFLGVMANATEMLLYRREERVRIQKLHMVSGLFFGELGNRLLKSFAASDPDLIHLQAELPVSERWSDPEFARAGKRLGAHEYRVEIQPDQLAQLNALLEAKSTFLLRLLENPILLEHGPFTELLRAIFHLREELLNREDLEGLPETDYAHLAGDIKRAYILLVRQWLDYMRYLMGHYPYLFSLAMRTNPFNPKASAVVKAAVSAQPSAVG